MASFTRYHLVIHYLHLLLFIDSPSEGRHHSHVVLYLYKVTLTSLQPISV